MLLLISTERLCKHKNYKPATKYDNSIKLFRILLILLLLNYQWTVFFSKTVLFLRTHVGILQTDKFQLACYATPVLRIFPTTHEKPHISEIISATF